MKTSRLLAIILAPVLSAFSAGAQTEFLPSRTVLLYADSLPSGFADPVVGAEIVSAGFEMAEDSGITASEAITAKRGILKNVGGYARIDLYFPEGPCPQMVLVLPGGGYTDLASYHEGRDVARWLVEHGRAAAILKYRRPNGHRAVPLEDVHNAMRWCRTHSGVWGVRQIGIMGFSAGGHLAATACNYYEDITQRPDFAILYYPVISFKDGITHNGSRSNLLKGSAGQRISDKKQQALYEKYSLENAVTMDTPPSFMLLSSTDKTVSPLNSVGYYHALHASGVEAELHIFPEGEHGFGLKVPGAEDSGLGLLEGWLDRMLAKTLSDLKVMSFNVRNGNAKDGDNAWQFRTDAVAAMIRHQAPDIMGVQEAHAYQIQDILDRCAGYECVGVGRDDGVSKGEHMSIFWNKAAVECLDWGTFWLSETPDKPSRGWDASYTRCATWAKMRHKYSGKEFICINTHLDNRGAVAKREGLSLVMERASSVAGGLPFVITGDFNVEPGSEELSEIDSRLSSARKCAAVTDSSYSFHAWDIGNDHRTLDHIYYNGFSSCGNFATITSGYLGRRYISDHYPVTAILTF